MSMRVEWVRIVGEPTEQIKLISEYDNLQGGKVRQYEDNEEKSFKLIMNCPYEEQNGWYELIVVPTQEEEKAN